jgi:hypothetical protein
MAKKEPKPKKPKKPKKTKKPKTGGKGNAWRAYVGGGGVSNAPIPW